MPYFHLSGKEKTLARMNRTGYLSSMPCTCRLDCSCQQCRGYTPPPEVIRRECQRLQESWSDAERTSRLVDQRLAVQPWTPSAFAVMDWESQFHVAAVPSPPPFRAQGRMP
jgi:hypothetical protein